MALANLHGLVDDEVRAGSHPNAPAIARAALERRRERFSDAPNVVVPLDGYEGGMLVCRVCDVPWESR